MNIKIKAEAEGNVKMLTRLLLDDYQNDIPVIRKKNSCFIELIDFPVRECLNRFRKLTSENKTLNESILTLQQEVTQLKKELEVASTPKQDLGKNENISTLILLLRDVQKLSFQGIADMLNSKELTNSRGLKFNRMQVNRLYAKYKDSQ